jgi:hypothetical protein
LPAEYARQRDPEPQDVRDQLVEFLGESKVASLTGEGESLGLDEALARTHTWLNA